LLQGRVGIRGLPRNRGYSAIGVLTLRLGIGANSAIFSVLNALLLRPLPYADGEQVVALSQDLPRSGARDIGFSVPEIQDLRRLARSLSAVVEYLGLSSGIDLALDDETLVASRKGPRSRLATRRISSYRVSTAD